MSLNSLEKRLRFAFLLGFWMLVATTFFEWRLRAISPIEPIPETGQVMALNVKGGRIFVRVAEYRLDWAGLLGGAGLCAGSLLIYCLSRRKPSDK